ncbi:hypothetical protein D3C81_2088400 [compost metagenome]
MVAGTLLITWDKAIPNTYTLPSASEAIWSNSGCSAGSWVSKPILINMARNTKIRLQSICSSTWRANSRKPANTSNMPYNGTSKSRQIRKATYSATLASNRRI